MVGAVLGTQTAAARQAQKVDLRLQQLAALDATKKLGLITGQREQMYFVVAHDQLRISAAIQSPECLQQQVKEQLVRVIVLDESVGQFCDIVGPTAPPQVLTQLPVRLNRFSLGHDVEALALGNQ